MILEAINNDSWQGSYNATAPNPVRPRWCLLQAAQPARLYQPTAAAAATRTRPYTQIDAAAASVVAAGAHG